MSKITSFTETEFLELEDKYTDMMLEIENRATEIAMDLGRIDATFICNDVCPASLDNMVINMAALFVRMGINDDEEVVEVVFPIEWLFSDDYKETLEVREAKQRITESDEYQEYLRLKAKYEGMNL